MGLRPSIVYKYIKLFERNGVRFIRIKMVVSIYAPISLSFNNRNTSELLSFALTPTIELSCESIDEVSQILAFIRLGERDKTFLNSADRSIASFALASFST